MKKIEQLTAEQAAYLPIFREEWLRVGLSTDRVDKEASTDAIKRLYAAGGYDEPLIMHFDSPWQCIMSINFIKNMGVLKDQNLWQSLKQDLWQSLGQNLGPSLGQSLGQDLGQNLWQSLGQNLGQSLGQSLGQDLWQSLGQNLGQSLKQSLEQNPQYVSTYFWGGIDAYWLAWAEFAEKIGVPIAKQDHLHAYIDFAKSSGVSYFYPEVAFVSDRPICIHKDDEARLHCEDGPALAFKDGYGVYTWHGTNIPSEWIEQPETLTPKAVLTEKNIEVRAAGIELMGWANMLDELDAELVSSDPDPLIGNLYSVTLPDIDGRHLIVKYTCPRNGVMGQPVPSENHINGEVIDTVMKAKAFLADTTLADYLPPEIRT